MLIQIRKACVTTLGVVEVGPVLDGTLLTKEIVDFITPGELREVLEWLSRSSLGKSNDVRLGTSSSRQELLERMIISKEVIRCFPGDTAAEI